MLVHPEAFAPRHAFLITRLASSTLVKTGFERSWRFGPLRLAV
jgi:hypothetical protein